MKLCKSCKVLRKALKFFIQRNTKAADDKAKEYLIKLNQSGCPTRRGPRVGKYARKERN